MIEQDNKASKKSFSPQAIMIIIGVFFYPFFLCAIPIFFYLRGQHNKEKALYGVEDLSYQSTLESHFKAILIASVGLSIFNLVLMFKGVMMTFLWFYKPFIHLKWRFETIPIFLLGTANALGVLLSMYLFNLGRKVESIEERQQKVYQSADYQKRREQRFSVARQHNESHDQTYQAAKQSGLTQPLRVLSELVLLGVDEYGNKQEITLKELRQHVMVQATTGGGKTTVLESFIDHCAKYDLPALFLDGKGARVTLENFQRIARKSGKEFIVFSDVDDLRYNPIKYGNSIAIRDRLIALAQTENIYYSNQAKSLLMNTIQFMDLFKINRLLKTFSYYLEPIHVLEVFEQQLKHRFEVKRKEEQHQLYLERQAEQIDSIAMASGLLEGYSESERLADRIAGIEKDLKKVQQKKANYTGNRIKALYNHIKKYHQELNQQVQLLFNQMFVKYEGSSEGALQLYKASDTLIVNLSMLLDSELGHLFDTDGDCAELDLLEVAKENKLVFITLNGLIYDEYIETLGHFIISEINYLCSHKYSISDEEPFLLICDEPQSYITKTVISTVNKGRGAGLCAIFSPQTLQDIEDKGQGLTTLLVGNINTFILGQVNDPSEAEYWAKTGGTYKDIDKTSMIEQKTGLRDIRKSDWVGERGTVRDVEKYDIDPKRLRALRKGEFYLYRKALDNPMKPKVFYARKVE